MNFAGKTVLITGGTSGIGRAAAERFAQGGAGVIVSGRDPVRGAAAVSEIKSTGRPVRFIAADLSVEGAARALAREAGEVDVLVNNAGSVAFGRTDELSDAQFGALLITNAVAPFALTAELAPGMADRGCGAIVNVSSMAARVGMPGTSAYGASKAALEALTRHWVAEYSGSGVRVNTVAPGPTQTPSTEPLGETLFEHASTLPMGRPAESAEIASAIVFLASDEASFITGATLAVDGGRAAV